MSVGDGRKGMAGRGGFVRSLFSELLPLDRDYLWGALQGALSRGLAVLPDYCSALQVALWVSQI